MSKFILIFLSILIFGLITVSAQTFGDDGSIRAWIEDRELEKDIFIRDQPSGFGKVLGEIPFVMKDTDKMFISIKGYSNGWMRIQAAIQQDETVIFSGDGWIKANRVGAAVYSPKRKKVDLFAKPKLKSKKVGTIPAKAMFDVIGYDKFGLKIRYKEKTGWLPRTNICDDPIKLCS